MVEPPTLKVRLEREAQGRRQVTKRPPVEIKTCNCGSKMTRVITCYRTGRYFWRCGKCKARTR